MSEVEKQLIDRLELVMIIERLHEERKDYMRTLWEVCSAYGKPGECIYIGMKAKLKEKANASS